MKRDELQADWMDCAVYVPSEENGMLLTTLPRTVFSQHFTASKIMNQLTAKIYQQMRVKKCQFQPQRCGFHV